MKNKNIFLISVFIILLVVSCLNIVSARASNDVDISLSYEPFPAKMGQNLELSFEIENTGTENLTNLVFDIDVNDPFTLNSNSQKTIASLNVGETKTIKYSVYVNGNAQNGKEQVTLDYKIDDVNYDEDFDVLIAPEQVYLQVTDVRSLPEKIAPGQALVLNIKVKNTAESEIRNVVLKLDIKDMPFAPQSVTEKRIDLIGSNEEQQVSFNLIALATANVQIYKIPLAIEYYDEFGTKYLKTDLISVNIFETPSIDITLEKNSLVLGMNSKLNIKVLNKGLGEVNFVEIRILPSTSDEYEINGQAYEYVGNIQSDDYSTVEFNILPKKQNVALQVVLEYRDVNNQKYSETKVLNVQAYSVQEARKLGLLPGFPVFLVIVILVVIALVIYFILRRRKRKKKLAQQQELK